MRVGMKTAPNPCLLTVLASYYLPPTRKYICYVSAKSGSNRNVLDHVSFSPLAKKCLMWFVCFFVSTYACICVFAPGFGGAVTTS